VFGRLDDVGRGDVHEIVRGDSSLLRVEERIDLSINSPVDSVIS
jgi:hypothetical protein